jgi:hypothetical protein
MESPSGPRSDRSGVVVAFHAFGLDRPLSTLKVPWDPPNAATSATHGTQPGRRPDEDQRFHWLPSANLLVIVPPTDDRLILRRIDIDGSLRQLGGDYLFVSSSRAVNVLLGRPFRHVIAVKSSRGQPQFSLVRGPAALRVSPAGELGWDQPLGRPGDEVEALIELSNGSGRRVTETFILRLVAPRGTMR